MMTDLDHIRQIELELGVELRQIAKINLADKGYLLNGQNQVIALGLNQCGIKRLEGIIQAVSLLLSLQTLSLDSNDIIDLRPLSSLLSLQNLFLGYNEIIDLEPLMALNMLKSLQLSYNPIKILPHSITSLPMEIEWHDQFHILWKDSMYNEQLGSIIFFGNPLESPPPGIVAQGKEAVGIYFNSLEKATSEGKELVPLQEVKVHLVGEGLAGKTSLMKQLQGLPFSPHESQTHGINVLTLGASQINGFEPQG